MEQNNATSNNRNFSNTKYKANYSNYEKFKSSHTSKNSKTNLSDIKYSKFGGNRNSKTELPNTSSTINTKIQQENEDRRNNQRVFYIVDFINREIQKQFISQYLHEIYAKLSTNGVMQDIESKHFNQQYTTYGNDKSDRNRNKESGASFQQRPNKQIPEAKKETQTIIRDEERNNANNTNSNIKQAKSSMQPNSNEYQNTNSTTRDISNNSKDDKPIKTNQGMPNDIPNHTNNQSNNRTNDLSNQQEFSSKLHGEIVKKSKECKLLLESARSKILLLPRIPISIEQRNNKANTRNREVICEVLDNICYNNIDVKIGANYIPPIIYENFLKDNFYDELNEVSLTINTNHNISIHAINGIIKPLANEFSIKTNDININFLAMFERVANNQPILIEQEKQVRQKMQYLFKNYLLDKTNEQEMIVRSYIDYLKNNPNLIKNNIKINIVQSSQSELQKYYVGLECEDKTFTKDSILWKLANNHCILTCIEDYKNSMIDYRLVNPHGEDHKDSRVNNLINKILEFINDDGIQIVFCDIKSKNTFNIYKDIVNKLIQHGINDDEIEIMQQSNTPKQNTKIVIGYMNEEELDKNVIAIHFLHKIVDTSYFNAKIFKYVTENDYSYNITEDMDRDEIKIIITNNQTLKEEQEIINNLKFERSFYFAYKQNILNKESLLNQYQLELKNLLDKKNNLINFLNLHTFNIDNKDLLHLLQNNLDKAIKEKIENFTICDINGLRLNAYIVFDNIYTDNYKIQLKIINGDNSLDSGIIDTNKLNIDCIFDNVNTTISKVSLEFSSNNIAIDTINAKIQTLKNYLKLHNFDNYYRLDFIKELKSKLDKTTKIIEPKETQIKEKEVKEVIKKEKYINASEPKEPITNINIIDIHNNNGDNNGLLKIIQENTKNLMKVARIEMEKWKD